MSEWIDPPDEPQPWERSTFECPEDNAWRPDGYPNAETPMWRMWQERKEREDPDEEC